VVKVLVVGGASEGPLHGIDAVTSLAEVAYADDELSVQAQLPDADALFFWSGRSLLERAWPARRRLRWIHSASDGVDGLLFPSLVTGDVIVTNARGIFDAPIAEWVLASLLAFETGLYRSVLDTGAGRWGADRSRARVAGQRLAIVGPGPIGRQTALRARALGLEVEAVGRRTREEEPFGCVEGPNAFHEVLSRANHVLNALPLTSETRGRFDADAFAAMRAGARFYNVGRGGTVDESALIDALRRGQVSAAALDVFAYEPLPPASPLWSMPNVIISPHVCGDFEGWQEEVVALFADNLRRFVRNEPLRNQVDVEAGFGRG
jgi:phosphoglycerate dehydrogenase-like enzyme